VNGFDHEQAALPDSGTVEFRRFQLGTPQQAWEGELGLGIPDGPAVWPLPGRLRQQADDER
jgi:hypothetical protein